MQRNGEIMIYTIITKFFYNKCYSSFEKLQFKLSALGKDDNVTPAQMAECCHELMKQQDKLHPFLNEGRLWITHYYSLLSDGEICIPWNWK